MIVKDTLSVTTAASRLRLVCKYWNDVVGASPELFSYICVKFSPQRKLWDMESLSLITDRQAPDPGKLERLLQRSVPHPLRITALFRVLNHSQNVWLTLLASSGRWEEFTDGYTGSSDQCDEDATVPSTLHLPLLWSLSMRSSGTRLTRKLGVASSSTLMSLTCPPETWAQILETGGLDVRHLRIRVSSCRKRRSFPQAVYSANTTMLRIEHQAVECEWASPFSWIDVATFPSLRDLAVSYHHVRAMAEDDVKHSTIPRMNLPSFIHRSQCNITKLELIDPPPHRLDDVLLLLGALPTLENLQVSEARMKYVRDEKLSIFKQRFMLAFKDPDDSSTGSMMLVPNLAHIHFSTTQSPKAPRAVRKSVSNSFPLDSFLEAVASRPKIRSLKLFLGLWALDHRFEQRLLQLESEIMTVEVVDKRGLVYVGRDKDEVTQALLGAELVAN